MNLSTTPSSAFWAIELTALVLIITLCLLIYSIRQNTRVLQGLRDNLLNTDEENSTKENEHFNGEQAEKWFEKGELQILRQYCENFIENAPNSVHANWYCALSHYNQGDYVIAREYFENVIRINPLWRDGAIVYLQEIAEKVGHINQQILH